MLLHLLLHVANFFYIVSNFEFWLRTLQRTFQFEFSGSLNTRDKSNQQVLGGRLANWVFERLFAVYGNNHIGDETLDDRRMQQPSVEIPKAAKIGEGQDCCWLVSVVTARPVASRPSLKQRPSSVRLPRRLVPLSRKGRPETWLKLLDGWKGYVAYSWTGEFLLHGACPTNVYSHRWLTAFSATGNKIN